MDRKALGIYKGVLNIWTVGGIRMVSRCMGASKHMGVSRWPQTYGVSSQCFERTDFEQFLLWEGMVVMKELILRISTLGRKWWSGKN